MSQQAGRLLASNEILTRLKNNQIFKAGTWSEGNMRAVGYDLRMADDIIVVPDPPEFQAGRFYPETHRRSSPAILRPGDVAFVTTMERFCVPWDISGQVGTKFSLSAKGVIVLTGTVVDPGYGLQKQNDDWHPKNDARLHFLLANVSGHDVVLRPREEKIATIQFWIVDEPPEKQEVHSSGMQMIEEYLKPGIKSGRPIEAGLIFFRHMSDKTYELSSLRDELRSATTGLHQVVMFGVYLLCITFLGVIFTVLLSIGNIPEISLKMSRLNDFVISNWPGILFIWGVFFTLLIILYKSIKLICRRPGRQISIKRSLIK